MSYDEAFYEAPCDTTESDGERAAEHQKALDALWLVGNTYDIRLHHMQLLCDVAGISFDELCKYSGKPVTCKTDIF